MQIMMPFQIDTTKIRKERARLNLSKKQLAEKIGETRFVIGNIENEKYKIVKLPVLEKVAETFGLKVEDLLKKEER